MSISAPGGVSAPTDPSRVRFLAFLLDDLSRGLLLAHVHELGVADDDGWTTHADHVTFAHTPSAEQLASFPWGVPCEMEVVGFACDERCRAVQVDVPSWVPVHPQVAVPHITVSCAPGARASTNGADQGVFVFVFASPLSEERAESELSSPIGSSSMASRLDAHTAGLEASLLDLGATHAQR